MNLIHYQVKILFILASLFLVTSVVAQKGKSKEFFSLDITPIVEWEKIIEATSTSCNSIDGQTNDYYYDRTSSTKNTFILHYRIASVEKLSIIPKDSAKTARKKRDYILSYNREGQLKKCDYGEITHHYFYDQKGRLDSIDTRYAAITPYSSGGMLGQ